MKLKYPLLLLFSTNLLFAKSPEDKYQWLEEVDSSKSMQWVRTTNKNSNDKLTSMPLYNELYSQALTVLNNKSRIPSITQRSGWLYNFWQDAKHPRGVYRKTTLKQFKKDTPQWQTILDMDEYSSEHGENYDFHGMNCRGPENIDCLLFLSPGGSDAVIVREFNLNTKTFIDNGFNVPLAKTQISWIDKNTVYIGTDFGKGSMTKSGYPRIVKKWKRGQKLADAKIIYSGDENSMSASAYQVKGENTSIDIIDDSVSFWKHKKYQLINDKIIPLNLPTSASISGMFQDKLIVSLKKDWQINQYDFVQGEVILVDLALLQGKKGSIESIIKPTKKTVIQSVDAHKNGILVTILDDVKAKLVLLNKPNGKWISKDIPFPENGALNIASIDDETGDFFVQYESFITPPTLYYVNSQTLQPSIVKQQQESFDSSQFQVKQYFTQSIDGTFIPYFVVMNKNTQFDGKNPTHIFSYGGFRNSLTPSYSGSYEALSGAYGKLWLERGGVFVLANIRGGGEYGPAWHAAALKKNRHKAFEDFESVATDLFERKITSAQHLGIEGRSNGGLLVTATMTRHPELYSAVVCGAPLIDMKRYNKLLAGASWMGEYGNPDIPEMWDYIKTYSPYQNVKNDTKYPPIFFYTSTRDDRVHPGHARKMAIKMLDLNNEVDYYENIEGGHHGFSTNEQLAHRLALTYTHLWRHLK